MNLHKMLTLTTSSKQVMNLTRDDARDLELKLKLNVSSKGRSWNILRNTLFNFHSTGMPAVTEITNEQFVFLELLQTKIGTESCKGL